METGPNRGKPRRTSDVRVDRSNHPDWVTAMDRLPGRGERVHTHEGSATVVAIHGKTSAGGRLIELSMDDGRKHAFFAAAANILVERVAPVTSSGDGAR
jgi:hypothetical protein